MGSKQSSLANKKSDANKNTSRSVEVSGKRGHEVNPQNKNIDDLVIVDTPTFETFEGELDTHNTNETEESDYDSDDEELGKLINFANFSLIK